MYGQCTMMSIHTNRVSQYFLPRKMIWPNGDHIRFKAFGRRKTWLRQPGTEASRNAEKGETGQDAKKAGVEFSRYPATVHEHLPGPSGHDSGSWP